MKCNNNSIVFSIPLLKWCCLEKKFSITFFVGKDYCKSLNSLEGFLTFFERELALLVALQGKSIWKGCFGSGGFFIRSLWSRHQNTARVSTL